MGTATYASIATSIIVAAVILGAGVFPLIDDLTAGETIEVSNEGASWIRMAYITDQSDYSAEYSLGDDGITVAGQTGEYGDMILYADSKNTLCIIDDQIVRITGNEYTIYGDDVETFTVSRTNGVVSFDDYVASESVEWAYVPTEGGAYGSFAPDTLPLNRYNSALAAVGGFAGIYAYNENLTYDAGLVMDADVTDKVINSVKWALPTEEPTEPEPLDIDPQDIDPSTWQPIDIDPINPFQPDENQIMAVPTPTYTDGDWGYELFNVYIGGVLTQVAQIVSYSGAGGGAITIPTTVGGYQVWALGKSGGQNTIFGSGVSATDLTIPDFGHTLMYVYPYAFADCSGFTGNLVINQPTITTQGNNYQYTFQNSGFVTATLPSTWMGYLEVIYGSTFKGCTSLTTVTFSSGTNIYIPPRCFEGCTSLTTIDLSNVSYISDSAFKGCTALTGNLDLPNMSAGSASRASIGNSAFEGCSGLTGTLTLGSAIQYIGNNAFKGCMFTGTLEIPANMKSIGSQAFRNCTGFTGTLSLPEGLTSIGYGAFNGCTGFTGTLTIPSTVTTFEGGSYSGSGGAFNGCTGFTGLIIEQGSLTKIPENAFNGCTNMTGVLEIPGSVVEIHRGAFLNTSFTGLVLNEGVQKLANTAFQNSDGAFSGCTAMTGILYIPSTVTDIGYNSFRNCGFTSLVVASDAVPAVSTSTGYGVFAGTPISQVLNLGSAEYTTTSYGLNAEEVRSDIEADSYLSVVHITESTTKEGAVFDIVGIIPLALVAGFLLIAVWVFFKK